MYCDPEMAVVLTLQVLDSELEGARIVAATRDATAMRVFEWAVLTHYQERVTLSRDEASRLLAIRDLREMQTQLELLSNQRERG